ncbi:MAG TPA: condensation domain-containing protein, partial [Steroidobacteraceae bacterium]
MNIHTGRQGTTKPRISQRDLDRVTSAVGGARQVEDIYPLSALQQGMLFHCQYEPQSAVYLTTQSCRLSGALDAAAFARAWQVVVDRHGVLRTAFVGQDLDAPLQVVLRGCAVPFETHDWRDLPAGEQDARFAALRQSERARGFDLAAPPLMRLALIRLAAERHRLIWTAHHLL